MALCTRRSSVHSMWLVLGVASALCVLPAPSWAQPFGQYLVLDGDNSDYIEVPHHADLNPSPTVTIEGWVRLDVLEPDCVSLIGKDYREAYWVGSCTLLRSYLHGLGSARDGGSFSLGGWSHFAVTSDGTTRRHFLNGVEVREVAEVVPPTASGAPVRIGGDVSWQFTPVAAIDELRLWNVVRTPAQIQASMDEAIDGLRPGLVAVWSFDGNADDTLGAHHGVEHGEIEYESEEAPPPGPWIFDPQFPDFEFKLEILPPGNPPITASYEPACLPETVCVSGALPGRTEVEVRIIGPRPNGYLWVNLVRFTVSGFRVWIRQVSTGQINFYELPAVPPASDDLPGRVDKEAFLP